jgi:hypothetical protein
MEECKRAIQLGEVACVEGCELKGSKMDGVNFVSRISQTAVKRKFVKDVNCQELVGSGSSSLCSSGEPTDLKSL